MVITVAKVNHCLILFDSVFKFAIGITWITSDKHILNQELPSRHRVGCDLHLEPDIGGVLIHHHVSQSEGLGPLPAPGTSGLRVRCQHVPKLKRL